MKTITRTLLVAATGAGLWLATSPAQAQAQALNISIDSATVNVGQTFEIDIMADIPRDAGIIGWDFNPTFDSSQVRWTSSKVGDLWDPFPTSVAGDAGVAGSTMDDPVFGDDVRLVALFFKCLAEGDSAITIATPDALQGFVTPAGELVSWQATPGRIIQNPAGVPDAGSSCQFLGFCCLLMGLAQRLWRRRSA